jgi:xanthine dehydrogenase accessory factor
MSPGPPIPRNADPTAVLAEALRALERGERVVVATVLARQGSAPSTPGQKLLMRADGSALGSVGGGAVELAALERMRDMFEQPRPAPVTEQFDLGPRMGMCCGGSVHLLLEPMAPAFAVLIVGAGHIGAALAPTLASLGFRVVVADPREGAFDGRLVAGRGLQLVAEEHDDPEVREALGVVDPRAAALVMTHDHQLDQQVVEWALRQGFGFVGGVGSRAKAARTQARLEAKGFVSSDIERVQMPLGTDIGARSPAEIAISIGGEMIRWRAELSGAARARPERAEASGRRRNVSAAAGGAVVKLVADDDG